MMEIFNKMFTENLPITISAASFLVLIGYFYLKNKFSFWSSRGLGGPRPVPFLGHLPYLLIYNRDTLDRMWQAKYGTVFGLYFGTKPILVVANAELMRQVCIRDFDNFVDHQTMDFISTASKIFIFNLKGDDWRRVRKIMSPTFTIGKMRKMVKQMDYCMEDFIELVKEQPEKDGRFVMDTVEAYKIYTYASMANCCYGIRLNRKGESKFEKIIQNDSFFKDVIPLLDYSYFKFILLFALPGFVSNYFNLQITPDSTVEPAMRKVRKMIQMRRENTGKRLDDYLQLLAEANQDDEGDSGQGSQASERDHEAHHADLSSGLSRDADIKLTGQAVQIARAKSGNTSDKGKMSEDEIISAASFLITVAVHTTSSTLSNSSYFLAHQKPIQDKLFSELCKIAHKTADGNITFDYDSLTECKYLDAFVSEVLRMVAPVNQADRVTLNDYHIKDLNLTVPRGTLAVIMINMLHKNPDYWPEPLVFRPERFMPGEKEKIVPGSYCPFGLGPRHCIGMRFALTNTKMAIAKLLMSFELKPAPNSIYTTETKVGSINFTYVQDTTVAFVPRGEVNLQS